MIFCILFISCQSSLQKQDEELINEGLTGENLAVAYCGTCHSFPEPNLLGRSQWETGVLPAMSARLGIGERGKLTYSQMEFEEIKRIVQAGIFPSKAKLDSTSWNKLCQYYLSHAPDSLNYSPIVQYDSASPFNYQVFYQTPGTSSMTTLLHWDPVERFLWTSNEHMMRRFTANGSIVDSLALDHPLVDVIPGPKHHILLSIGIIHPQDRQLGWIGRWNPEKGLEKIQQGLARPVQLAPITFNLQKDTSWILAEYGNYLGKLSVLPQISANKELWTTLSNLSGAIDLEVIDMNKDNIPDIVCLMAQGNEAINIFYGTQDGSFSSVTVLNFPPVYGSNSVDVIDYDNDGDFDIVYTNGDNADYSPVLKPYHGIRLFENLGNHHFSEQWFVHIPGISKVIVKDFDLDGDLDFVANAFFPNYQSHTSSGFIFLENTSETNDTFTYNYHIIPQCSQGRWMVMESGDPDSDGDTDIWLGSFTFAPTPVPPLLQRSWYKSGINIAYLENKSINP